MVNSEVWLKMNQDFLDELGITEFTTEQYLNVAENPNRREEHDKHVAILNRALRSIPREQYMERIVRRFRSTRSL